MTSEKSPFDDMMKIANLEGPLAPLPVLSVEQLAEPEPFVPGYTPRKNGDPVDLTTYAAKVEPANHPELVTQFADLEAKGPKPFSPDGAMAAIFALEMVTVTLQEQVKALRDRIGV